MFSVLRLSVVSVLYFSAIVAGQTIFDIVEIVFDAPPAPPAPPGSFQAVSIPGAQYESETIPQPPSDSTPVTPSPSSYESQSYDNGQPQYDTPVPAPSPVPAPAPAPTPTPTDGGDYEADLPQVVLPFQPVVGYPAELQGIWTADPVNYIYSSSDDPRILSFGTTQCDIYLVTNLGISVYDYSPVARCDELGALTTRLFLKQIEGDVAQGTDYTIYYALLSLVCTGDQEGQLIEVSSQGTYQCVLFKRIDDLLYIVYGFVYPTFEETQCPTSWDVDVATDQFADSSIVYSSFDTGVYAHDLATCMG